MQNGKVEISISLFVDYVYCVLGLNYLYDGRLIDYIDWYMIYIHIYIYSMYNFIATYVHSYTYVYMYIYIYMNKHTYS